MIILYVLLPENHVDLSDINLKKNRCQLREHNIKTRHQATTKAAPANENIPFLHRYRHELKLLFIIVNDYMKKYNNVSKNTYGGISLFR